MADEPLPIVKGRGSSMGVIPLLAEEELFPGSGGRDKVGRQLVLCGAVTVQGGCSQGVSFSLSEDKGSGGWPALSAST